MRLRFGGLSVLVALALLLLALAPAGSAATPRARVVFHLSDPRLREISGIAAGIRSPGVVYVQNDSGDSARFFALSATTGAVLAQYDVPGATNVDWEDIAVAPDASGTPSVWIADTGDNQHSRSDVVLYRVDEPKVDPARHDVVASTSRPDVWRLRYPGGPADVESLAVTPHGAPYLITKTLNGDSAVFAVPTRPSTAIRTVRRVGMIQFVLTGTPGPFGPFGQLTATGADFSRDGSVFVVRTYTDAYLWRVGASGVAAALRTKPAHVPLPREPQGEGICLTGGHLLIDSEGVGTAVYEVPLPALPHPSSSRAPRSSPPRASSEPPVRSVGETRSTRDPDGALYLLAGVAGVAIIALAGLAALARRRGA